MAEIQPLLLSALDDMLAEDLRRFKFWLSSDLPEGFKPIGQGKLESKKREEIVKLMVRAYGEKGAVKVTLHVLRKANQNDLAERLEKDLGGNAIAQAVPPCPEGQGQDGASSKATSGSVPLVSIQCAGGKVQAPTFSQSTFSGNTNMTFN